MERVKEGPNPDNVQEYSLLLQQPFRNISLKATKEDGAKHTQNILLGRLLTTRTVRHFTIQEIIRKAWKLKNHVSVEGGVDNIFQFSFEKKEDRDCVYRNIPWSLDGAHLILKEWQSNLALSAVKFDTTSFSYKSMGFPRRCST